MPTNPQTISDLLSMYNTGQITASQDYGQQNVQNWAQGLSGAPSWVQNRSSAPFTSMFQPAAPAPSGSGGGERPYDLGIAGTEVVNKAGEGIGFGSSGGQGGLEQMLASLGIQMPTQQPPPQYPYMQSGNQPNTYGILNPSEFGFGFGNGVPGGNLLDYLMSIGYPDLNLATRMDQGQPFRRTSMPAAFQQLGGIGLPSLQSMEGLGPSGLQSLLGMLTTMLGTSDEDLIWGAQQPTRNLQEAPTARQVGGYFR